jgi:hypothetical protein
MAIDKQYLGALYKKLSLQKDAQFIEQRATVLESLSDNIHKKEALSLVAIVYGIDIPKDDIEWFLSAFQQDEPGFASDGVDNEVELLAAASLRQEIDSYNDDSGLWPCLLLETANFGGLRTSKGDPTLIDYARKKLQEFQTTHNVLNKATYHKKIDINTTYQSAETAGASNQWQLAHPAVKQTIEAVLGYTDQGLEWQATQLNNTISYIQQLEEQTQTQWWAIAGWSESANMPYAKQSLEEATLRSAVELANITTSTLAGPIAAPALFNMVLTRDRKPAQLKKLVLKNVVTKTPMEWRKSWLGLETKDPYTRLCPIALAIGLATESNDEPDWEAQFARKVTIGLTTEMSPIEIATQLFRELLVLKGRD